MVDKYLKEIDWAAEPNMKMVQDCYALISVQPETARSGLEQLANVGSTASMMYLGDALERGAFGVIDHKQAEEWFHRASVAGLLPAFYRLGISATNQGNYLHASKYFSIASDAGYAPAMCRLAVMYMNGIGVVLDRNRAILLLETAARIGNFFARRRLSVEYISGRSGPLKIWVGLKILLSLTMEIISISALGRWRAISENDERILC